LLQVAITQPEGWDVVEVETDDVEEPWLPEVAPPIEVEDDEEPWSPEEVATEADEDTPPKELGIPDKLVVEDAEAKVPEEPRLPEEPTTDAEEVAPAEPWPDEPGCEVDKEFSEVTGDGPADAWPMLVEVAITFDENPGPGTAPKVESWSPNVLLLSEDAKELEVGDWLDIELEASGFESSSLSLDTAVSSAAVFELVDLTSSPLSRSGLLACWLGLPELKTALVECSAEGKVSRLLPPTFLKRCYIWELHW
jgi:hypothetical protein